MATQDHVIDRRKKEPWRVDKNIPIALIVVLILQTGTFITRAAELDASVADHERRISMSENYDREYSRANLELCQRLARVEEKVVAQMTLLQRIDETINRIHKGDK